MLPVLHVGFVAGLVVVVVLDLVVVAFLLLSFRNVSFSNETGHAGTWATHGWWCTESLMAKVILRGYCLVRVVA